MIQCRLLTNRAVAGKFVLIIFMAALLGILFLYLPTVLLDAGNPATGVKSFAKEFDRRLAEGVHAVQPWSGQTVSFRACRVTKPKMGGFRLGSFNVLEIDELEITLPCASEKTAESGSSPLAGNVTAPLQRNLDAEKLSAVAGLDQRVSMLWVRGFRLFILDGTRQRVPVVIAKTAKSSGTKSISLEHCELLTEQLVRIHAPKAKLHLDKPVLIEAAGQRVNLDNLAAVLKNKDTN
jgi:hypothetical protein